MQCAQCKKQLTKEEVTILKGGVVGDCTSCGAATIEGNVTMSEMKAILEGGK